MSSSALNSSFMFATAVSMRQREAVALGLVLLGAQLRSEQVQGVQRLAQVVACRRQEARLGQVGLVELLRALLHLALQRGVGALQLGCHVVELVPQRLRARRRT